MAFLHEDVPVYAVGGVVRDHLLGRGDALADLDLIIARDALAISRRVADRAGWAYFPLDATRDLARLVYTGDSPLVCDVSGLRGQDLESDLRGRDFTINAMAFALDDGWLQGGMTRLIDVCGGRNDLDARILRRVTAESLPNDPLRLLRAVRLAAQFGLHIEEATRGQIATLAPRIAVSSPERIRDEVWKALTLDMPERPLVEMQTLGLLSAILPEVTGTAGVAQSMPHYQDVYGHTLETVRYAALVRNWLDGADAGADMLATAWQETLRPWRTQLVDYFRATLSAQRRRSQWLVWHALFHDVGKPQTQRAEVDLDGGTRYRFLGHETAGADLAAPRLAALRFSSNEVAVSKATVTGHMRPHTLHTGFAGQPLSRRACYRFFRDLGHPRTAEAAGSAAALDVLFLALADYQAIYGPRILAGAGEADWRHYLGHIEEALAFAFEAQTESQQTPVVNGHQLMEHLKLSPGPQLGQLLAQLAEAQAVGDITTQEEGLMLAAKLLHK